MRQVSICGLRVHDVTMAEAVLACLALVERGGPAAVYTPNAEMAKRAMDDAAFMALLNRGDLVVPDGAGVLLAARMLRRPLREKVAGVELAAALLPAFAQRGTRLFLFGGRPGIAERAAQALRQAHPGLVICGVADGYFSEEAERVEAIRGAGAQAVYVCLGVPKQERFIDQNRGAIPALMLGLGGTLDLFAGEARRAPDFWIRHNLEWLYRGGLDPRRWSRLMQIPAFLWAVQRDARGRRA
ncbi:MAG: WecB/TagA/CpsF family glycosyltransferase [Clostridiales bacterium]|nr:WecB/TagA/CpsF family glycosyltransferase [Clostridiales bacterium]